MFVKKDKILSQDNGGGTAFTQQPIFLVRRSKCQDDLKTQGNQQDADRGANMAEATAVAFLPGQQPNPLEKQKTSINCL